MIGDPFAESRVLHRERLNQWFMESVDDAVLSAATGHEGPLHKEVRLERQRLAAKRTALLADLPPCPHCGAPAEVVDGIDCGIDGGPSPVTMRGVQIRCSTGCGMKTDRHSGYPGEGEQLRALGEAVEQWRGYAGSHRP